MRRTKLALLFGLIIVTCSVFTYSVQVSLNSSPDQSATTYTNYGSGTVITANADDLTFDIKFQDGTTENKGNDLAYTIDQAINHYGSHPKPSKIIVAPMNRVNGINLNCMGIILQPFMPVVFEGGVISIQPSTSNDVFKAQNQNDISFSARCVFYIPTDAPGHNLIHLTGCQFSDVYIHFIGSSNYAICRGGWTAISLDGGCNSNKLQIDRADAIGTCISLTGWTHATNIDYLLIQRCSYGVYLDGTAADNYIKRVVVTGGGGGVTYAAVYLLGFNNHVTNVYGEYPNESGWNGPLVNFAGVPSANNRVDWWCQDLPADQNPPVAVIYHGTSLWARAGGPTIG